ncbi:hypothetical protein O181_074080 [Austropuccinia psidii MF-1]|uniref:Peptidase A2 domain-containing protein n=1 Tax=Austropuccinia psidii MF-1 TaxID=1389203 RepID=A0A9Q3FBR2_9BASI|nr:hypothetical protein [Austropuccinia psidii MF-1]
MSPKFFNQLKNLSEEEKKSINSIDTKEIQTKLINHHLGNYEQPKLHYACPLGFMQVYLGEEGHEIMALVDTGSELNIIPEDSAIKAGLTTRFLNMNLRGIGGHCTSIVGLAEFTPITLVTGEERNIHLFVARGAVHTVLGRPFLADNNIRLDFSQQKGEIFSYIEPDGRRLCLPICSPQKVGWREEPPAGMETCAVSKLEDWKELPKEKNPEEIKRKSLTKLLSPIKALKSLSKGIFRNNWKASIKPAVTIIIVTSESKGSSSQIDKSTLKALKEVSLKDNISKRKHIITQNHLIVQKENMDMIPKSEESESLNEILKDTIKNSHYNNNTYPQASSTCHKGSSKIDKKPNFNQNESVIPQDLMDPSLRFNQILIIGATKKKKFKNLEKSQISFPSNFENIDPRILMEGIIGESKSFSNRENIDPRLIREELELTRIIESPIRGNKQKSSKKYTFWFRKGTLKNGIPLL